MRKLLYGAAFSAMLCGCTSLVSGNKTIPIAPSDPEQIDNVRKTLLAPNIVAQKGESRPIFVVKFAFDGTLNDETRVPDDERATIVSYIASRVPSTHYYPGVGMQSTNKDMFDATLGRSMFSTAAKAKDTFFAEIGAFLIGHPDADVRVFVTGFSRGAATARHFMNSVEHQWEKDNLTQFVKVQPSLRFYALLYDTVSTGQRGNPKLHLEINRHLNYLMHFVARDEPRPLYEVDIDLPDPHTSSWSRGIARINTLYLPGAHSDVGASYRSGVGDNYRELTDYVLSMFGLISDQCFDVPTDSLAAGKHDPRGLFDKLAHVGAPNTQPGEERPYRFIRPMSLTSTQAAEIRSSNQVLIEANMFRSVIFLSHGTERFGFAATHDGARLRLTSVQPNIVANTAKLSLRPDGSATFDFAFAIVPQKINSIRISTKVVSKIKPEGSTVGVTYLSIEGGQRFTTFVDNVPAEQVDWRLDKEVKIREAMTCGIN
jgi:hypothetical protein